MLLIVESCDWSRRLADAIETAEAGDVIIVDSDSQVALAERALFRKGKAGVKVSLGPAAQMRKYVEAHRHEDL